jgi:hypothetical protein
MVSHQNKCIFIHIPKAAGTSLARVFQDSIKNQKSPVMLPFKAEDNKFDPPPPHLRASDYIKYGHVTKKEFRSYFKFSMVRNPWDRIVSEYKYRRHPIYYDFKTFLFSRLPKPSWSDAYCHVIPQYDFLYDSKGNCLVDFIGKVENIQEDFNKICNTLGMQNMLLPHANKSLSLFRRDNNLKQVLKTIIGFFSLNQTRNTFSHYTEYYDEESKQFVSKLYKKDIETFSYDFGS